MAGVKGKGDETTRTVGVNATLEIRDAPVTTMRLEGLEIEPPRVRGKTTTQTRQGSHCHLLSSSRSFNLFRGSSGLKGEIRRGETNLGTASIIETSDIEPMTIIGSVGY